MSSFNGHEFSVIPDNKFFPNVEDDGGDDPPSYSCDCLILSKGERDWFINAVARGSAERTLGTTVWNYQHETGQQLAPLIVPVYGGNLDTFSLASLRSIGNIQGYGQHEIETFKASMKFWIISSRTP